jgi:hypothetical protein
MITVSKITNLNDFSISSVHFCYIWILYNINTQ